jgi:tetratricopeptide (TPR) repeat protein
MKKKFVIFFSAIMLCACSGKKQKQVLLAKNHYRQAANEMQTFFEKNDTAALRRALNEIDASIEHDPAPHTFGLKGTILLQLGELNACLPCFEHVFNNKKVAKSKRADAQNNYATALYQLNRTQEAQQTWINLTTNPHYISPEVAYFNLGLTHLNEALKKSHDQHTYTQKDVYHSLEYSITYFRQALSISKEYIDALFFLGQALIARGRLPEARDCYISLLISSPHHKNAQSILNLIEKKIAQSSAETL